MSNWVKLYATRNVAEANIIRGMLEQNEIPVQVLNRQDSSYLNFGDIELYVPEHLSITATQLMNSSMFN